MAKILVVKSSILGAYSQSAKLIGEFLAERQGAGHQDEVVERDLGAEPLPALDGVVLGALAGQGELTAEQQGIRDLSQQLIDEIQAADMVIIGLPMYNFGMPSQLKSWIDLICRAGITFTYTETGPVGLLTDKPVLIVTTTGGVHKNQATDLALSHLKTVLGFVGLHQVTVAYAQALNMGPDAQSQGLSEARAVLTTQVEVI
ncbi:FMN-dependent NADH-azoreductase [Pseudaeromonas paramecii]|uniref:FMN dependent NADH:quinone oxidoreductase n=1 Tax=Pseudaeromonas paramecii TaxID=2138166 RepID=A0ABP8PXS6_9GAMM